MGREKICLASDNWAPAHPLILQSLLEANIGCAPASAGDGEKKVDRRFFPKVNAT